ncbi:MAG: hypothetical protein M0P01_03965 [Treponema sp.]|nr:hypothetical protein [Treponema sp.]
MEAQKTLDKIRTDWVLWKREMDREVIESDRKTIFREILSILKKTYLLKYGSTSYNS